MAKKTAALQPGGKKNVPDEERGPTAEERFAAFSARYKWYFFVPILVAIAVVVVLAVTSSHRRKWRQASADAYRSARSVEDFDAVARDYQGSFAGARALVSAGDLLYTQGRYAEARQRYADYLGTEPDPALGMPVRAAVVQTYIAEEDYEKAIAECEAILGEPGREYAEEQAMYYRAYAYELSGDLKAAEVEYKKLLLPHDERGGRPRWSLLADERYREVSRKLKGESKNAKKDVDTPALD